MENKLTKYSQSIGMSPEEYKEEIEKCYAVIKDMELDEYPDGVFEQSTVFKGHKIIITYRRELLN